MERNRKICRQILEYEELKRWSFNAMCIQMPALGASLQLAYIEIRNGGEESVVVARRINKCGYDRRKQDVLCI